MNDRDSEAVEMDLVKSGFEITAEENEADVIILNTCSVRDQAERKALGKVGNLKKLLRKKPSLQVGVIGCMAQSRADDIVDKNAHVNFVAGTDQLHKIPELIKKSKTSEEALVETGLSRDIMERLDNHPEGQMNASVAIMRGCNEYCTYCIVPFTRGQEKSRTIASIIAEVTALADKGVREIMYLGQNITAYGLIEARRDRTFNKEASPFAELLRETAKIEGIKRIRFTSPHARYFNDDLIDLDSFRVLEIYPNPVTDDILNIEYFTPTSLKNQTISIIDLLGREIYKKSNVDLSHGKQSISIDLKNIPIGVFFLEFSVDSVDKKGIKHISKFIKQ